jgi:ATP-dependent RNA helicase DDX3X
MAEFDLNDMGVALSEVAASEVGTEKPKPAQNFVGAPKDVEEANKKARDHKWVDKTEYDYNRYNPKDKNAPPSDSVDLPSWASNAVKYEWQDEWGDVGPRVAELEAELFDLEFLHRKGHNYNKLELEVKAEGGVHIDPIAKVRSTVNMLGWSANYFTSSRKRVYTLS